MSQAWRSESTRHLKNAASNLAIASRYCVIQNTYGPIEIQSLIDRRPADILAGSAAQATRRFQRGN